MDNEVHESVNFLSNNFNEFGSDENISIRHASSSRVYLSSNMRYLKKKTKIITLFFLLVIITTLLLLLSLFISHKQNGKKSRNLEHLQSTGLTGNLALAQISDKYKSHTTSIVEAIHIYVTKSVTNINTSDRNHKSNSESNKFDAIHSNIDTSFLNNKTLINNNNLLRLENSNNDKTGSGNSSNINDALDRLSVKGHHLKIAFKMSESGELSHKNSRIDCLPDMDKFINETRSECIRRGCLWDDHSFGFKNQDPICYIDKLTYGYKFVEKSRIERNLKASKTFVKLERLPNSGSMFGNDYQNVGVMFHYVNEWLLRVKIYAITDDPLYEVPVPLNLPINVGDSRSSRLYNVSYDQTISENPFHFSIEREGTKIWDTSLGGLTIARQFNQIATKLPSTFLYGFGEKSVNFFRNNFDYSKIPMFNRDQYTGEPAWNLYGSHPYYLCMDNPLKSTRAHGVLLLNSNAMEVILGPMPYLSYRTIGGILDFYFIFADNPELLTQKYMHLIGFPYIPPYWSLGFHLSRYGYNSLQSMQAAVNRTIMSGIPLDVLHGDIDHFDRRLDFTIDPINFSGLGQYVKEIKKDGIYFFTILDPAIQATDSSYLPFVNGLKEDVFIKWPSNANTSDITLFNSTYMHGYVWPDGETVFPDFFKPQAKEWWKKEIVKHHNLLNFDGIWIDMNDPTNFGTNEPLPWNWKPRKPDWSLKCPISSLDDPPYKPTSIIGNRLSDKTICMVGVQTDGTKIYNHYDVHNLYTLGETQSTLDALREATGKRSLVISRSTFVGSGTKGGHWLGDNFSAWSHMHQSIIGILDFTLFGINYVGADICGFNGNATEDLCQRWMQLGSFYPFSRNHNSIQSHDQDPASFSESMIQSSKAVLEIRYSLLPYLYTLFYFSHTRGSTIIRPLFFEFPEDLNCFDIDRQFLWGSSLLISPVLEQNATSVRAYFPKTRWFDFHEGKELDFRGNLTGAGEYHNLSSPINHISLHVRGGSIMVTQSPSNNTKYSRLNNFGLIVAPNDFNVNPAHSAIGYLFWDDGETIDSIQKDQFWFMEFTLKKEVSNYMKISMKIKNSYHQLSLKSLEKIRYLGFPSIPKKVETSILINEMTENPKVDVTSSISFNQTTKELFIRNLSLPMIHNWVILIQF